MELTARIKMVKDVYENTYKQVVQLQPSLNINNKQKEELIKYLHIDIGENNIEDLFDIYFKVEILDFLRGEKNLLSDLAYRKVDKEQVLKDIDKLVLADLSKNNFRCLLSRSMSVEDKELGKKLLINDQGVFEYKIDKTSGLTTLHPLVKDGFNILEIFYHTLTPLETLVTFEI